MFHGADGPNCSKGLVGDEDKAHPPLILLRVFKGVSESGTKWRAQPRVSVSVSNSLGDPEPIFWPLWPLGGSSNNTDVSHYGYDAL